MRKNKEPKNCIRCGTAFEPEHPSRKYCSQSCRQYAYMERNGMRFQNENQPEESAVEQKQEDSEIVLSNFSSNIYDGYYTSSTHSVDIDNNDVKDDISRFNAKEKPESEKKRQQIKSTTEKDQIRIELPENEELIGLKDESNENLKPVDDVNDSFDTSKPVNTVKAASFQYVKPEILQKIEEITDRGFSCRFTYPENRWNKIEQACIRWINIRFHCLLENLLRLSYLPSVNKETFMALADAFEQLNNSFYFNNLPADYPYKGIITELNEKLNHLAGKSKHSKYRKFCLTVERKAEIIAMLWEIGNTVPRRKFSDLFNPKYQSL